MNGTVIVNFPKNAMPTGNNSVRICLFLRDPADEDKDKWEAFNMYLLDYAQRSDSKGIKNWTSRYQYPTKTSDVGTFCNVPVDSQNPNKDVDQKGEDFGWVIED